MNTATSCMLKSALTLSLSLSLPRDTGGPPRVVIKRGRGPPRPGRGRAGGPPGAPQRAGSQMALWRGPRGGPRRDRPLLNPALHVLVIFLVPSCQFKSS